MNEPAILQPKTEQQMSHDDPEAKRRKLLRLLYQPYSLAVFIPYLTASTITLGSLATLVCQVSPRLAYWFGTVWSWSLCRMNFTPVRVVGRENAVPGQSYVIMSNHQSHFDVLAFYGHWGRQFRWVMKEELRRVPGLGWYCSAGGHIFIDRSSREAAIRSLREAKPLLDGGVSVMIFPEGTRSRNGRLGSFKKGGFMMALELGLPILPVSISGSRHVLPGKSLLIMPAPVTITIHPPIDPASYGRQERDRLIADVRTAVASGLTPWERRESARVG